MSEEMMGSQNFEFLRRQYPELADLGGFAEKYLHADPASAVAKLRLFAEQLVARIYQTHQLQKPYQAKFIDLLTGGAFTSMVPQVILDKIHLLRKIDNRGVHGEVVPVKDAVQNLSDAFDLARWFHLFIAPGERQGLPAKPGGPFVLKVANLRQTKMIASTPSSKAPFGESSEHVRQGRYLSNR